jgi:sulfatase maturation enzyme AslB (radical SAM superfamily)
MTDTEITSEILKANKSFCVLPFIHLHVNEKNNVQLCCLANGQTIGKYDSNFDFATNKELQQVRHAMLAGERVEHCNRCYAYEDAGADSSRQHETQHWFNKLNVNSLDQTPVELCYYDIRNDNLCNLSCRMCNPHFSTQLVKEYAEIGWNFPKDPKSYGFTQVVNFKTVKKIYVAGGEPSLMPEFRKFLTLAIEHGRPDIEIRMNTNVTNLNKEYRELLSKFTNLEFICSIDGHDQINKYIRWPADWHTIVENVHGLRAITGRVAVNVTVGIWNISNLSHLVTFLEREFPEIFILLNENYNPDQNATVFPDKDLAIADLELLKNTSNYKHNPSFKSKVNFYIKNMQSATLDQPALERFFEFNDTLDRSRGITLADYIPELENCRRYIK